MGGSKTRNPSAVYFNSPSALTLFATTLFILVVFIGMFNPEAIPDQYMGPIGLMYRHMVYTKPWIIHTLGWALLVVHIGEAFYSLHLMNLKGISDSGTKAKWFFQTLVFGVGSLSLLIKYKPNKSK